MPAQTHPGLTELEGALHRLRNGLASADVARMTLVRGVPEERAAEVADALRESTRHITDASAAVAAIVERVHADLNGPGSG